MAIQDEFCKAALLNKSMPFSSLLKMVRSLRAGQLRAEEYSLRPMFERLDRDHSQHLEISELTPLLEELGLQPKCWEDQMTIRRLLDDTDEDHNGSLNFDEFSVLVQRLRELLTSAARRRQHLAANELGFSDRQVAELRDVFFPLDTEQDGLLRIDQLRKALVMLKLQMSAD